MNRKFITIFLLVLGVAIFPTILWADESGLSQALEQAQKQLQANGKDSSGFKKALEHAQNLIDKGSDVNGKNDYNMPLFIAFMDQPEIAEFLFIKNNAKINQKDGFGFTPLHALASSLRTPPYEPKKKLLISFLKADANVNAQDIEGLTPLMRYLQSLPLFDLYSAPNPEIAQLFIAPAAAFNAPHSYFKILETGLKGHIKKELMNHNIYLDTTLKDKAGKTIIDYIIAARDKTRNEELKTKWNAILKLLENQ